MSSTTTDQSDNGEERDDNGMQSAPGAAITSPVINLAPFNEPTNLVDGDDSNSDQTVDFGFFAPVKIGDTVWYDSDVDGKYEPGLGELGVAGVQVALFNADGSPAKDVTGAPVATQTTGNDGKYLFQNLPPGSYFAQFALNTLPTGYIVSTQDAAGVADDLDSDANSATGRTQATPFVSSGEQNLTLDMGIWAAVAVGDMVWNDLNHNGVYEPAQGENGVAGVKVTIFNAETNQVVTVDNHGNPVVPQTTDSFGRYLFDDLPPANYYVVFDLNTLPQGYLVTTPDLGNEQSDSDADPATGKTAPTGLLGTQTSNMNMDMGIYRPVVVGNSVWFDDNHNGLQDATEAGVPGVKATLFNAQTNQPVTADAMGNPVVPLLTDASGSYRFEGLPPGSYYVAFDLATLPSGYTVTTPNIGADDAIDSDVNPQTGKSDATPQIAAGGSNVTIDMGIWAPVAVGDKVWYDVNGNGIQEQGETPMAGVKVTLYDATTHQPVAVDVNNAPLQPQTTNANGNYLFTNLPPGNYYVKLDLATLPQGYKPTLANQGNDDTADSDVDPTSAESAPTGPLSGGTQNLDLDMGLFQPARLGGVVWDDGIKDFADGIKAPNEKGIAGATVILKNADGVEVGRTVTDQNGNFLFENLPPGDYWLSFVTPPGTTYTDNVVVNGETNSDPDPATGSTNKITLSPGVNDLSWGAGFVPVPTASNESAEPNAVKRIFLPIVSR